MWKTVKLGEIASWVRGLTYSKKDEVENDGIAVLRATNIELATHKIVLDEIRYVSEAVKVKEEKYAQLGDLLVCTASGSKSHVGKVAIVEEELGMAFGGFMAAIRCNEHCIPRFLYHVLTSQNFKWHLKSLGDGANINNLKFSQIEGYEFPLPSLAEQQRIVAKLDATFTEIDKAINLVEAKQANAERLKASLLEASLKGDDAMWTYGSIGDVLALIQNGVNCKQDKSGVGEKITRIETIAESSINYAKTGFSELDEKQKVKAKLEFGDILFSHINSPVHVGKTAHYDGKEPLFHGINLLRLQTIDAVDSSYFNMFLVSLFQSGYWKKTAKQSVNQASVNQTDIKSVPFSYPPLAEQKRIVAKLDAAFAEIETILATTTIAKENYLALKASVLTQELRSEAA